MTYSLDILFTFPQFHPASSLTDNMLLNMAGLKKKNPGSGGGEGEGERGRGPSHPVSEDLQEGVFWYVSAELGWRLKLLLLQLQEIM